MDNLTLWGIHTRYEALFTDEKNPVVALGWEEVGDLSLLEPNKDAFKEHYRAVYQDAKAGNVSNAVGQLYRFAVEMKIGDYIVFPCRTNRQVYIGRIIGEYTYDSSSELYRNRRTVNWEKKLPRTVFSQGALYEIGAAMSLFTIKNYADEFWSALEKGFKSREVISDDDNGIQLTTESILDSTKDFILKKLSKDLKGYYLENFVGDLLTAMGYKITLSKHGGDSGVDLIAYKDELPPRILVQVKSGNDDIRESTLQSLKGAMSPGDYGLFITLADYTKNAKEYLKHQPIIKALNGSEFVDLILKYYEGLSKQFKNIIPLSRVYIPDIEDFIDDK